MDKGDLLEVFEDIFSNCDVLISSLQKEKGISCSHIDLCKLLILFLFLRFFFAAM